MCNLFANLKGLIIVSFLIAAPGCSQERVLHQGSSREGASPRFADTQTAAAQSLQTFGKLITKDNYKELGFDSVEEVVEARLGAPLAIFFVRLDRLREYQPGSDPNTLLADSAQVYY